MTLADRRSVIALGIVAALLGGCGSVSAPAPRPGQMLPPAPYGARVTPTPQQLLTPSNQARPVRSDDLLQTSQDRRDDVFDLPPQR